jgi:hypothetical protein
MPETDSDDENERIRESAQEEPMALDQMDKALSVRITLVKIISVRITSLSDSVTTSTK